MHHTVLSGHISTQQFVCWYSVALSAPEWAPAAPVSHLEAGQRRAVIRLPGLDRGGNLTVCVTHGALFSQHGGTVYGADILPVNDLVSSD